MSTVRPADRPSEGPAPFASTRSVVILVLALLTSVGLAAAGVIAARDAGAGSLLLGVVGMSTFSASMIANVSALNGLIGRD